MNKHILHDHLDGGLRPSTADDIAKKNNYEPLLEIEDVQSFFDRSLSNSLEEYLEAFTPVSYTHLTLPTTTPV